MNNDTYSLCSSLINILTFSSSDFYGCAEASQEKEKNKVKELVKKLTFLELINEKNRLTNKEKLNSLDETKLQEIEKWLPVVAKAREEKDKVKEKINDTYQSIKSSYKTDLYIIRKEYYSERFNQIKMPLVVRLIKELEKSSPELYQVLTDKDTQNDHMMIFRYKQNSYPFVYPTFKGLIAYVEHYKNKYGISITVLNNESEISTFLQNQLQDKTERFMAIIFDPTKTEHVVSLIVKFHSKGAKAIILDVITQYKHEFCKVLENQLMINKIPTSICQDPRQADTKSCRVGALVTLRNALLNLKSNKSASAIFDTANISSGQCSIPAEWGFTDQIFKPKVSIDSLKNPRQLYSTKEYKRKAPESIQESRNKYQHDLLHFKYKITLSKNPATEALDLSMLKLPPEIKCFRVGSDRLLRITISKNPNLNVYMLYKGFHVAKYLNNLDANNKKT